MSYIALTQSGAATVCHLNILLNAIPNFARSVNSVSTMMVRLSIWLVTRAEACKGMRVPVVKEKQAGTLSELSRIARPAVTALAETAVRPKS